MSIELNYFSVPPNGLRFIFGDLPKACPAIFGDASLGGFFLHNNALAYILRFGLLFSGTTGKMIGEGAQLSCDLFA
jgi:hypothetical protein